jgi:hypothetical protein
LNRLLAIPFVCAAVVSLGMLFPDARAAEYYRVTLILAASATALSAFITTRHFAPGDRLFLCWLFVGTGYTLAVLRYGYRLLSMMTGANFLGRSVLDGMLIVQNVLIAAALWLFVRAWGATGLATPGSGAVRFGWTMAGIAVALAVGGYPLIKGIATAGADTVLLVSTLGDMVGIALIVPLIMSALALRGGLLMHTWLFLASSEFAWLLYDIWLALRQGVAVGPRLGLGLEQIVRIVAILFAFAATVAQRRAIR